MTGKTILVTSGKGGVGKTTCTANIATAFAVNNPDQKVCTLDMDIGLRNLDLHFGLENKIVYNFVDYLDGKCDLNQAYVQDYHHSNLYLIPAAQTKDKDYITPENMLLLVEKLREEFDIILIDCPAGIERGFHNSAIIADEAIIVTNPEMSAIRDADRIINILDSYPKVINPWLIINKINPLLMRSGDMMSIEQIIDILRINLLGVIPNDDRIVIATNRGTPIVADMSSQAGQAFRNVAKRLSGENIPLMDFIKPKQNLFVKQLHKLKSLILK